MTRRVTRVRYHLDSSGVEGVGHEEIVAILRGADDLIMRGGRTLLSRLLKGSKEKKISELGLDKNPSYGYYADITLKEVLARVDWMIERGYLALEYDYRLPMLVFTEKGWDIEKETCATELLERFDRMIDSGAEKFDMNYLKDGNRDMISILLDKVEQTKDRRYIPLLEAWKESDYKKVRQRISGVIRSIAGEKD